MVIAQPVLFDEVQKRGDAVRAFISEEGFLGRAFSSLHLRAASGDYLKRGGKSLRPAVVMFCAGALGGDEDWAIPAAAAVEVTHNWTLIHDDIIDRDQLRRGKPTTHNALSEAGRDELALTDAADHYGVSLAILGGDIGQCWAVHLLGLLRDNDRTAGGKSRGRLSRSWWPIAYRPYWRARHSTFSRRRRRWIK